MPSSARPSPKARSMARRFFWLALLIVLAIAGYTAGWFWLAGEMETRAKAMLAGFGGRGDRAVCENVEARGYPFRIGLFCDAMFFEARREGLAVATGAMRSAAQVYDPLRIVAEVDGPARVNIAGIEPLDLNWATLRASARLARPVPSRLSAEATELRAEADLAGGRSPILTAGRAELHLRGNGEDVDLAARFDRLLPDAGFLGTGQLPVLGGLADVVWRGGAELARQGRFHPRGNSFDLRSIDVTAENGARMVLRGPLSIGEDGLIDAQLQVMVSEPAALAALVTTAAPELAQQVNTALAGLSLLGDTPTLPLTIVKGVATLGFIPLGTIPPI